MSYEVEEIRRYELKSADLQQLLRTERRDLAVHQRDVNLAKDRYKRSEDSFNSVLARMRTESTVAVDPRLRIACAAENQTRLIASKRSLTAEQEILSLLEARQSAMARSVAKKERAVELVDSLAQKIESVTARRTERDEMEAAVELSTAARAADAVQERKSERIAETELEDSRWNEVALSDPSQVDRGWEVPLNAGLSSDPAPLSVDAGASGNRGQQGNESQSGDGASDSKRREDAEPNIPWDKIRELSSAQNAGSDSLEFTYTTESGEDVRVRMEAAGEESLSVELVPGSKNLTRLLRGDQERIRGLLEEQGYRVRKLAVGAGHNVS